MSPENFLRLSAALTALLTLSPTPVAAQDAAPVAQPSPDGAPPTQVPGVSEPPEVSPTSSPAAPSPPAGSASAGQPVLRADKDLAVAGGRKFGSQGEPAAPKVRTDKAAEDSGEASLKIGAGVILWYYQPLLDGPKNHVDTFFARITADGKRGIWGLHIEPRFRDTKQRSFEDGPVFLQEAYLSASPGPITVKAGKAYSLLGLFWDNSFYGNVQVYDGLKLAPDYGISVEAAHDLGEAFALRWALQYFVVDGRTNVSLPNRDIVSVPNARRRNAVVARVDPELKLGGKDTLRFGVSGQLFQADLPGENDTVIRGAVDAKLALGGLGVWGEVLYQSGRHVTSYPIAAAVATDTTPAVPGRASGSNLYALAGAEYTYGPATLRFNASFGEYMDVDVSEHFLIPSLGLKPIPELLLLVEYVHWRRSDDGSKSFLDRSLNVTAHGFF